MLGREVLDICDLHGGGEYVLRFMCREQGRFTTIASAKGFAGRHVEGWWVAWRAETAAADEAARREGEVEAEARDMRRELRARMQRRIAALGLAIREAGEGLIALTREVHGLIATVLADPDEGDGERRS